MGLVHNNCHAPFSFYSTFPAYVASIPISEGHYMLWIISQDGAWIKFRIYLAKEICPIFKMISASFE